MAATLMNLTASFCRIVVTLSGRDVSSESYEVLADALRRNSHLLTITIEEIDPGINFGIYLFTFR